MFIKYLTIESPTDIKRELEFKAGLNLIIDTTPKTEDKLTGNNVGKTTVLKLIDFCLGGNPSIIYTDTENKKDIYTTVKEYLVENEIIITLTLVDNLTSIEPKKIVIRRNFLQRGKAIRSINEKEISDKDFEDELQKSIFPDKTVEKPTFRQIISHNIRYKDENINNTLKTLNKYTSDVEYESLYLFLLGCTSENGAQKQELVVKLNQEESFKKRLEKMQTRSAYEISLAMIEDEINVLNDKKSKFNLNEDFENDLEQLNSIKYQINKSSSSISKMCIRKELIEEAKSELENSISHIDVKQLKILYSEAKMNVEGIQKTFTELVEYHNNMLVEKARFIAADLPSLLMKIDAEKRKISRLLAQERELSELIAKGDSFDALEKIIGELNEKYRLKGEYESIISQLDDVEGNIEKFKKKIQGIDSVLFSDNFEEVLKQQRDKFNRYFSSISQELYDEKYALKYEKVANKNNQQVYKFSAFNANMSSGKKQGEILCFDLAYTMFADDENISCLHFLLNDKKELMHNNQLIKVADFVQNKNLQLVISILRDKLPKEVMEKAHTVIELSQNNKLFRIEANHLD